MNNNRRKELGKINEKLENVLDALEKEKTNLESVYGDEELCKDNMPENLQGSLRYESSENACECLEEAIDELYEAIENIKEAINS